MQEIDGRRVLMELPRPRYLRGALALIAGCLIIMAGDRLLGIEIELWWGLDTFNALWFVDMFIVPLIGGLVVGIAFGLGGKWLCYFPPLIVRCFNYYYLANVSGIPDGASLMPMGWWGFFVILTIEAAAIGGVAGEILVKRTYGRMPKEMVYKSRSESVKSD